MSDGVNIVSMLVKAGGKFCFAVTPFSRFSFLCPVNLATEVGILRVLVRRCNLSSAWCSLWSVVVLVLVVVAIAIAISFTGVSVSATNFMCCVGCMW